MRHCTTSIIVIVYPCATGLPRLPAALFAGHSVIMDGVHFIFGTVLSNTYDKLFSHHNAGRAGSATSAWHSVAVLGYYGRACFNRVENVLHVLFVHLERFLGSHGMRVLATSKGSHNDFKRRAGWGGPDVGDVPARVFVNDNPIPWQRLHFFTFRRRAPSHLPVRTRARLFLGTSTILPILASHCGPILPSPCMMFTLS